MVNPEAVSDPHAIAYPPAPWSMVGQLWLTLFRVRDAVDDLRPAGVYGAAFVSYEDGSPLTYSELLVARPVNLPEHGKRVSITDIWVDSPASVAGGRALWAIPKQLCDFDLDTSHTGPWSSTRWSASAERRPIAEARFRDVSRAALRLPFKGGTWQPPIDGQVDEATAALTGSARSLPCRATWDFAADGPLAWLRGSRQLASFRMSGFRMTFA
jgi:hypothetical protein